MTPNIRAPIAAGGITGHLRNLMAPILAQDGPGRCLLALILVVGSGFLMPADVVQARAAGFVDATAAGLICDGHTDNADVLDRVAARSQTGTLIYLAPAAMPCLTSRPFTPPSNTTIWADPGTVVLAPTPMNASSALLLAVANRKNVIVHGLCFDGGGSDLRSANSLAIVYRSDHIIFDHVTFRNAHGISVVFSTNVTHSGMLSSTIANIGNHFLSTNRNLDQSQGVDFCCGAQEGSRANFVQDTNFSDIGLDGLAVADQTDFHAEGNRFRAAGGRWENGGAAIWASHITGLVLADNVAEGSMGNGFDLSFLDQATIFRNKVLKSGGGGIELSSSKMVEITYNETDDNWQSSKMKVGEPSQHRGGITLDVVPNPMWDVVLKGNVATNTEVPGTQAFGIQIRGNRTIPGLVVFPDNRLTGNRLGPGP